MTKLSHLAELFLQDSLYPLLMRRKCGNVGCMCKSLHSWTAWGPRVLWGWRSHSESCGLEREIIFHVSAHPLADQLLLFIYFSLSWLNKLPVCLRRHGHGPPKTIGKKMSSSGRTDRMVSVWLDGLHNFGEQGHAGLFLMPTWTGNLQQ